MVSLFLQLYKKESIFEYREQHICLERSKREIELILEFTDLRENIFILLSGYLIINSSAKAVPIAPPPIIAIFSGFNTYSRLLKLIE